VLPWYFLRRELLERLEVTAGVLTAKARAAAEARRAIGELEVLADLVVAGALAPSSAALVAADITVAAIGELEVLADLVVAGALAPSSAALVAADITVAAIGELEVLADLVVAGALAPSSAALVAADIIAAAIGEHGFAACYRNPRSEIYTTTCSQKTRRF
jgi:nitroreductase